jgi:hypothetical protein
MLLSTYNNLTVLSLCPVVHLDPLEQFDVLSISVPLIGGLTNLSLLLALNILLMAA